MNAPETIGNLRQRLNQCEHALQRCERLAVASRYAGAVMHEVNNPLAAITNLVFLTKLQANNPELVRQNMEVIETQLRTLGKVTGRVLAFHRDQSEPSDTDLIEIVESALKLHSDRITAGNVALRKVFGFAPDPMLFILLFPTTAAACLITSRRPSSSRIKRQNKVVPAWAFGYLV